MPLHLQVALLIANINQEFGFSWKKVVFLGLIASFNKGMSRGGYRPLVTGVYKVCKERTRVNVFSDAHFDEFMLFSTP
ncbi:MAG: hypothetical protein ACOC8N_03930 [Spirochaetota bacterium]